MADDLSEFDAPVKQTAAPIQQPPKQDDLSEFGPPEQQGIVKDYKFTSDMTEYGHKQLQWKKKGPIGIAEYSVRFQNNLELIPFVGAGAMVEKGDLLSKAYRLKDNDYGPDEQKQKSKDYAEVRKFAMDMNEFAERGLTPWAKMYVGGTESATFFLEFIASAGVGSMVKKGAVEGGERVIKKKLRDALGEYTKKAAKGVGKEMIRTGTAMAHRVGLRYQDQRLSDSLAITDKGQLIIQEAEDSPATAVFRAYTSVLVDNIAEVYGGKVFGAAGKSIKNKLPKKMITDLVEGLPNEKLKAIIKTGWGSLTATEKTAAWHGILAEYGEERLADIMRLYVSEVAPDVVLGRELSGQEVFDKSIDALFPDAEDALVEFGVLSIFGGTSYSGSKLINYWKSRGKTDTQINSELQSMSEADVEKRVGELEDSGQIVAEKPKIDTAPSVEIENRISPMQKKTEGLLSNIQSQKPLASPLESQANVDNVASSELSKAVEKQGFEIEGRSLEELKELAGTTVKEVIAKKILKDTRGSGKQLHGTSKEIDTLLDYYGSNKNIYGSGLYTTDAADIAFGYKKKGKGKTPKIYEIKEKRDLNLFDMNSPISDVDAAALNKMPDVADALAEYGEAPTLTDVYDTVRELSLDKDQTTSEVQEIFDQIQGHFEDKGFDGFEHVGGMKTGSKPHNVKIYFKPGSDLQMSEVNEKELYDEVSEIVETSDVWELTTREIKKTKDYKDWRKYASENYQDKDINPSLTALGHTSFTAERLSEFMDDGIGMKMYQEMIKPVYDANELTVRRLADISEKVRDFGVLEGSKLDRDAFLYAEKKLDKANPKAVKLANYIRDQYDSLLVELNDTRKKVGVEAIPKRKDYITHLNELTVLSDLLGIDRVSTNNRIKVVKNQLIEEKGYDEGRAWEAAKREVDGAKGVNRYIDAKHARFDFVKQRLGDYQANPSIIRSFKGYLPQAVNYIDQAVNVAKNKAFKDVLPPNAKEMMRKWNTEAVAGRPNVGIVGDRPKRILSGLKGQLGANIILGNIGTVAMQLTSFPQVIATAGVRNTFYGIQRRLVSYVSGNNNFNQSQVKALRDLGIDMGLGDSFVDQTLDVIGKWERAKDSAAKTRHAIDLGRRFFRALMEKADQFTVGATYEAFYYKGTREGLDHNEASDYANIMTGKTQANYHKTALPSFLNSFEGKTLAQFGTYGMNQFQFFKRDFGKDFKYGDKSDRKGRGILRDFIKYLVAAYLIDSLSELAMSRQPYDIKSLVDEVVAYFEGDSDERALVNSLKDTSYSYIPFLGSAKYKTMPPLLEFGKDAFDAVNTLTDGDKNKRERAQSDMVNKWSYNVLLPYGGNQMRKTVQGIEMTENVDLPFPVKKPKTQFEVKDELDRVRAWMFGGYAMEEAREHYENMEKRTRIKDKYELKGSILGEENIDKLNQMTDKEFDIYVSSYSEKTLNSIIRRTGRVPGEGEE